MQTLLSLHHVDFYQSGIPLLNDISLSLKIGEVMGLLGVNGAGKSTTLKIAAGLLLPSKGHVSVQPQASIGYLPEVAPLIDTWSVKAFLHHVCHLHGLPKSRHQAAIDRVVEQCHLQQIFKQSIATLSKGNRQRLAVAQAVIHQPTILILDEPTSGLDPQQISQFRELIQSIKSNTAILLSSHIMHEVTTLCDSVSIIHQGQKKQQLSLAKQQGIFIEFENDVPAEILQKLPEWQSGTGRSHYFSVSSQGAQNDLIQRLLTLSLSIYRLSGSEQMLENTFLQLIGQSTEVNRQKAEYV